MRLLITNDDGITASGLETLAAAFERDHEVWVIAPDGERSGMSHSLSLHDPIRVQQVRERWYAVGGSPADCVVVGITGVMGAAQPDAVLSGINQGPNLGTDVIFSGTAAAARQASFMGYPGIALSMYAYVPPFCFEPAAAFVAANIELLTGLWDTNLFININFPNTGDYPNGYAITSPARRLYVDNLRHFDAPGGVRYFFMAGTPRESTLRNGTDWHAVEDEQISISPISVDPVNHDAIDHFHEVALQLP